MSASKTDAESGRHEEMGFHQGWGTCVDQLAALTVRLKDGA